MADEAKTAVEAVRSAVKLEAGDYVVLCTGLKEETWERLHEVANSLWRESIRLYLVGVEDFEKVRFVRVEQPETVRVRSDDLVIPRVRGGRDYRVAGGAMTAHSPTPWNLSDEFPIIYCTAPDGSTDVVVAEDFSPSDEDLEFIVRCVNAHEGLVKALAELVAHIKAHDDEGFFTGRGGEPLQKAEAALAAAGVTR